MYFSQEQLGQGSVEHPVYTPLFILRRSVIISANFHSQKISLEINEEIITTAFSAKSELIRVENTPESRHNATTADAAAHKFRMCSTENDERVKSKGSCLRRKQDSTKRMQTRKWLCE